jgi:catechol 2,3-dioxygenase-like lactoylglutathione lyase family enzyme
MQKFRIHVAVNVNQLEENLKFYRAFFGAEPAKVKHNYAKFELNDPPLHFSMNVRPHENHENNGVQNGVLNHFGLQVENTEAVLKMKERIQEAGLTTIDEMGTTCCYAVQDKFWVRDPEGNLWEIFYTKEDSELESAGDRAVQVACCISDSTPAP